MPDETNDDTKYEPINWPAVIAARTQNRERAATMTAQHYTPVPLPITLANGAVIAFLIEGQVYRINYVDANHVTFEATD